MGGRGSSSGGGGGYKHFSDKARSTHTYEGDGQDTVDFFDRNSNYYSLISNMTDGERNAFRYWTVGGFMYSQQYDGWDRMDDDDKEYTQIFDDILDRSTLSTGVELTRRSDAQLVLGKGNRSGTLEDFRAMEGQIITCKGNMSFGAASQGLTIGDSSKRVEYKLKIPGGTKGPGMFVGDHRINGWGPDQREFMTNRDISIKVGKTTYDSKRGVHVVEVEYLGRQEHDYGRSGRV